MVAELVGYQLSTIAGQLVAKLFAIGRDALMVERVTVYGQSVANAAHKRLCDYRSDNYCAWNIPRFGYVPAWYSHHRLYEYVMGMPMGAFSVGEVHLWISVWCVTLILACVAAAVAFRRVRVFLRGMRLRMAATTGTLQLVSRRAKEFYPIVIEGIKGHMLKPAAPQFKADARATTVSDIPAAQTSEKPVEPVVVPGTDALPSSVVKTVSFGAEAPVRYRSIQFGGCDEVHIVLLGEPAFVPMLEVNEPEEKVDVTDPLEFISFNLVKAFKLEHGTMSLSTANELVFRRWVVKNPHLWHGLNEAMVEDLMPRLLPAVFVPSDDELSSALVLRPSLLDRLASAIGGDSLANRVSESAALRRD